LLKGNLKDFISEIVTGIFRSWICCQKLIISKKPGENRPKWSRKFQTENFRKKDKKKLLNISLFYSLLKAAPIKPAVVASVHNNKDHIQNERGL